jgi:hypothetical protein
MATLTPLQSFEQIAAQGHSLDDADDVIIIDLWGLIMQILVHIICLGLAEDTRLQSSFAAI